MPIIYFAGQLILTGVAAVILVLLVKNVAKDIYYRKSINNSIIAQSFKNKLNIELIGGITLIAMSIISLLQERYIQNVYQMFSPGFISNLKSYAYNSENLKLLITLYCPITFVLGISQLYNGLYSDAISSIGVLNRGKMLKWEEFASYSWGEYYEKQTFNHSTGYYDLELAHKNGKVLAYILKKNESPINLKIRAKDKDKVDKFLLSVI